MTRYLSMFTRLEKRGEAALVPFTMLGDPDSVRSLEVIERLVAGGADALELGLPFSDPVADGPVMQRAALRALAAGTTFDQALQVIREVRARHSEIPMGLLTYANPVTCAGIESFYQRSARAGIDSVLVADVPAVEAGPFVAASRRAGVAPILVLPQDADTRTVSAIARLAEGYTYVLSRAGVTGLGRPLPPPESAILAQVRALGGPPPLVGFGIATEGQVRAAIGAGARGVIVGSALVRILETAEPWSTRLHLVETLVQSLKDATRAATPVARIASR